jgi:hypothetical protein
VADRSEDDVYYCKLTIINKVGTVTTPSFTLYWGLHLITDRTNDDVQNGTKKGFYNAEDMNRVESAVRYLATRLRNAPEELKTHADDLGVAWDTAFDVPYDPEDYWESVTNWPFEGSGLSIKTNWDRTDIPRATDLSRYLQNIKTIVGAVPGNYPVLPDTMRKLTWGGANDLERALELLDANLTAEHKRITALIDNTAAAWLYSGDLYAGEV